MGGNSNAESGFDPKDRNLPLKVFVRTCSETYPAHRPLQNSCWTANGSATVDIRGRQVDRLGLGQQCYAAKPLLGAVADLHRAVWTARLGAKRGRDPCSLKWPPNESKSWRRPVDPAGTLATSRKVHRRPSAKKSPATTSKVLSRYAAGQIKGFVSRIWPRHRFIWPTTPFADDP